MTGRNQHRRRAALVNFSVVLVSGALVPSAAPHRASADSAADWPQFHGGPSHSGRNLTESVLTPASVKHLKETWRLGTTGPIDSSPAVVGGVVYAQSNNGRLYALHASTGREKQWSFLTNNNASTASPAVSEGLVYIASYRQNPNGELVGGSTLYAVDASTGHRKWTFAADGRMAGDPTVSQGTVYIGGYRAQCSKKIGTRSNCDSSLP